VVSLLPLRRIQIDGERIELWTALGALALKALAIVMNRRLDFPQNCYHVPGDESVAMNGKQVD
jgi:hypothetical protein